MATAPSPVLADAADVLSEQWRRQLRRLAELVAPEAAALERRFLLRLQARGVTPPQRRTLTALTPGTVARLVADDRPLADLVEHISYHGRRLAKLNLLPNNVVAALQEYDAVLDPTLRRLDPAGAGDLHWVREQLHFCVVLTLNNAYYAVREAETRALYDLFRVELEADGLQALLGRYLRSLMQACGAHAGRLVLQHYPGPGWPPVVHRLAADVGDAAVYRAEPPTRLTAAARRELARPRSFAVSGPTARVRLVDASWARWARTCWSVPLGVANGRAQGAMQFAFNRPYGWLPRECELLTAAADRCVRAAEKARLAEELARREEQVRRLAEHLLHVEERERRRISRELHDEAGQSLQYVRLSLEMTERALPDGDVRRRLAETRQVTEHTIVEIRRLLAALSPAVLEQFGLGAALRQLVARFHQVSSSRVRLQIGELDGLPRETEAIAYRLIQECCHNIAKHAQATRVHVAVGAADMVLKLVVADNGVGFDVEEALAKRDSYGLSGLRERVALLGGHVRINSRRDAGRRGGRGTRIEIELPLPATRPEPSDEE